MSGEKRLWENSAAHVEAGTGKAAHSRTAQVVGISLNYLEAAGSLAAGSHRRSLRFVGSATSAEGVEDPPAELDDDAAAAAVPLAEEIMGQRPTLRAESLRSRWQLGLD
jgi:hypothetical protein